LFGKKSALAEIAMIGIRIIALMLASALLAAATPVAAGKSRVFRESTIHPAKVTTPDPKFSRTGRGR
jgi:hypothetical protein